MERKKFYNDDEKRLYIRKRESESQYAFWPSEKKLNELAHKLRENNRELFDLENAANKAGYDWMVVKRKQADTINDLETYLDVLETDIDAMKSELNECLSREGSSAGVFGSEPSEQKEKDTNKLLLKKKLGRDWGSRIALTKSGDQANSFIIETSQQIQRSHKVLVVIVVVSFHGPRLPRPMCLHFCCTRFGQNQYSN